MASSLAYSWHASSSKTHEHTIALMNTPRAELRLRAENLHALKLSSLDPHGNQDALLCLDDVRGSPEGADVVFPSSQIVLVDHNKLLDSYAAFSGSASVCAIVDHHADEGHHASASPRLITLEAGSCASLVGSVIQTHIKESVSDPSTTSQVPPEVATILLCAILVDTNGLKTGGKARQVDYDSAAFLIPFATTSGALSPYQPLSASASGNLVADTQDVIYRNLADDLLERKSAVDHLGTIDLLKRDYKEYLWKYTPDSSSSSELRVGLSTVPLGLKPWLKKEGRDKFWTELLTWMDGRDLDVEGILTSFRSASHKEGKKGKHKRQLLFVVRDASTSQARKIDTQRLAERLFESLGKNKDLKLEERDTKKWDADIESAALGIKDSERKVFVKAWKQGDVEKTRKFVAPLLKDIVEGEGTESSGGSGKL